MPAKGKATTSRKDPPARKKILRKEQALEGKISQLEDEQLREIPSDPENHPLSPFSSSRVEESTCPISATPLHEPTRITSNPSTSNEHQHQVISSHTRLSWKHVKKYSKTIKLCTGGSAATAFDFIINQSL